MNVLFGLFLSLEKYFSLSLQKDSSILRPAIEPGIAQSTGLNVLSTVQLMFCSIKRGKSGKLYKIYILKYYGNRKPVQY